jgi:hypothetical protein
MRQCSQDEQEMQLKCQRKAEEAKQASEMIGGDTKKTTIVVVGKPPKKARRRLSRMIDE